MDSIQSTGDVSPKVTSIFGRILFSSIGLRPQRNVSRALGFGLI
jgi:hypothetical protein